MKTYTELSKLKTFKERYDYLNLNGKPGSETFGFDRILNQSFYKSKEWKNARDKVILRDGACDLGIPGREIKSKVLIHHLNSITEEQIINRDPIIFDPENLICVTHRTHNAIHYGSFEQTPQEPITRKQGDTKLW